jgi:hypothetical protein
MTEKTNSEPFIIALYLYVALFSRSLIIKREKEKDRRRRRKKNNMTKRK